MPGINNNELNAQKLLSGKYSFELMPRGGLVAKLWQ